MRIGFVVNDVQTEKPEYTTTRLALAATRLGHDAWMMGVGDFSHRADGTVGATGAVDERQEVTSRSRPTSASIQGDEATEAQISRRRPRRLDAAQRSGRGRHRPAVGRHVGHPVRAADVANGTLVVNDPASLANAVNKTYFQHFPEFVRPRTLISRDPAEIGEFVHEVGDSAVLKPLQGSGGSSVFLVSSDESPNLNQMIEAIGRDGYIVAQEFLAEAEHGDVRLFVMNGRAASPGRRLRRLPPRQHGSRPPVEHARRRQARAGRGHRRRCSTSSKRSDPSSSTTACSSSGSTSSATS